MAKKEYNSGLSRRTLLKGIAATAPMSSALGSVLAADEPAEAPRSAPPPTSHTEAMERDIPPGYSEDQARKYFVQSPASDVMVDALRQLGIDYVASNPGSSFRGLQESITTYGGNHQPEFLTCLHEESSVGMAHGYAKIAGKPMAVACHGTVGLQHASMAIYNAWCDRAPVIIIAGNHLDVGDRRNVVAWAHSVQDAALIVRDYTKWDDNPVSVTHFLESLVRAYQIAMTPPMGPVVIVADAELQEQALGQVRPHIPAMSPVRPPRGDDAAIKEAARLLISAEHPVLVVDRVASTASGMERLIQLAEALQAPVIDKFGRMNFPNDHYLNQTLASSRHLAQADVIIGMELTDFWGSVNRNPDLPHAEASRTTSSSARLISLGVGELFLKSNYQNFARYQPVDLAISGDAEATLPDLIEEVKRQSTAGSRAGAAGREKSLRRDHAQLMADQRDAARHAWDASPISTARLCMELWKQIREHDWSLVSEPAFQSYWPQRLWTMNQHHQFIGGSGGFGVGYGAPAAVGAALANRQHSRLTVNIQADGDMMYAPGVFWTAAHHGIPLLSVMHNNRAYHQEVMHLQRMGLRRQRGVDGNARIGTVIDDPPIDFAQMAASMRVWSSRPITEPADLAPALLRAIDVVDQGEPALVDVVCQPR